MARLIEITGKALSGEWGTDDETGEGIPVLRTTNFTNEGVVNYNDVVTRKITKKNINIFFIFLNQYKSYKIFVHSLNNLYLFIDQCDL